VRPVVIRGSRDSWQSRNRESQALHLNSQKAGHDDGSCVSLCDATHHPTMKTTEIVKQEDNERFRRTRSVDAGLRFCRRLSEEE
jgi:hypothetical protein